MESDQLQPPSKQPAQARTAVRKAPKKAKNATKAAPAKEAKARQQSAYHFFAAEQLVGLKVADKDHPVCRIRRLH